MNGKKSNAESLITETNKICSDHFHVILITMAHEATCVLAFISGGLNKDCTVLKVINLHVLILREDYKRQRKR